ncbi:AAA family ATPase [bacterium]|nr:AAA family ATPase [bacterium]
MKITVDLHIHSHYSRATSKDLTFEHLWKWAQIKGIHLLATGDVAHPGWLQEMRAKLVPAEDGLFRLKDEFAAGMVDQVPAACRGEVRFLLGGEISNIYKRHDAVRKVHNLIFFPSLAAVEKVQIELEKIGNIRADGRPILGLDSRDLLEIVLTVDERGHFIPAHIWTPWFSMLGSKSGFDSVEACFGDLTGHIFALETGLSSDPPMNWRVSNLDRYTLVSNSDAHSPQKLGREATLFHTELSYDAIFAALKSGDPSTFGGTIEFFPEEGKYHLDGHRKCNVCWHPQQTQAHNGRCAVCGKPVTVGVMHRVETLADRAEGEHPARTHPFHSLIPLPEILSEILGAGVNTKTVQSEYFKLLNRLGPELDILRNLPPEEIAAAGGVPLAEGIARMRQGQIQADPGYDGEYGVIRLFTEDPNADVGGQIALFEEGKESRKSIRQPTAAVGAQKAKGKPTSMVGSKQAQGGEETPLLRETSAPIIPSSPQRDPQSPITNPQSLNPAQQRAVEHTTSPLLIVAGPGTGKTRTLTLRIDHLIRQYGVAPANVLAITFTNKAAEEMAERLTALLGEETAVQLTVKTFHALGAQILAEWGDRAVVAILDDDERLRLLRRTVPELTERQANAVLARISDAKNQLIFVDGEDRTRIRRIEQIKADEIIENPPKSAQSAQSAFYSNPEFIEIYRRYEDVLRLSNTMDFDDLILDVVRLCVERVEVLTSLRARFQWISVDEYQDVNLAQYWLLRLLAGDGQRLCAIGDPDQAIYGFRGADHRFFGRFAEDYPNAVVLHLIRNYRSAPAILDAAQQVIAQNPNRQAVELLADFADNVKLDVYLSPTDKAEAEFVVHQIEQMVGGTSYFSLDSGRVTDDTAPVEQSFADFAVLYRFNAQARLLQEAFDRSGIPYQTVGQTPFYARKPVRALLDLLWIAYNPQSQLHWERLLTVSGKPPAHHSIESVIAILAQDGFDAGLPQILYADGLSAAQRDRALAIAGFYRHLPQPTRLADFIEQAQHFWAQQGEQTLDAEDLRRLLARAARFGDRLGDFLVSTALQIEADAYDPRADRVTLMTIHAAKGLEFPTVFVVGCEDGLLPYLPQGREADVAEERRLFYVAMTRAARRLILCQARRRLFFGQPMENPRSRFVDDIEQALLDVRMAEARLRPQPAENRQLGLFD